MGAACEEQSEVGADTVFEEQSEFGAAPNLEEDQIQLAEDKALECWDQFKRADADLQSVGIAFGHALIDLRDKKKAAHERDWLAYLEKLRISYSKVRYWIAKVEDKPTDRHKKNSPRSDSADSPRETQLDDWDVAAARLAKLKDDVTMLKQRKPVGGSLLKEPLASMAKLLGYELRDKGGSNA